MRVLTDSRLDADASARRWPDTAAAGYIFAEQPATDQESGFKPTAIINQDPVREPEVNLIVTRTAPPTKPIMWISSFRRVLRSY